MPDYARLVKFTGITFGLTVPMLLFWVVQLSLSIYLVVISGCCWFSFERETVPLLDKKGEPTGRHEVRLKNPYRGWPLSLDETKSK